MKKVIYKTVYLFLIFLTISNTFFTYNSFASEFNKEILDYSELVYILKRRLTTILEEKEEELIKNNETDLKYYFMCSLIGVSGATDIEEKLYNEAYDMCTDYPEYFDSNDRNKIVELVNDSIEEFLQNNYIKITLEQAKIELFNELNGFKAKMYEKYEKQGIELAQIENYVRRYIADIPNQNSGELYTIIMNIANRIEPESDKQIFLDELYENVQDYLNDIFGKGINQDDVFNLFTFTIDAVAGIFTYKTKVLLIILPAAILQVTETLMATIGLENGIIEMGFLELEDIVFNKIPMIDINIFNYQNAGVSDITEGNVLFEIRQNIASWYYAIRNLTIVLELAILIYIGIRMAISTIAEDKAKYKKMLVDWIIGFALIFVLQYIMIFFIQLNEGIINALQTANEQQAEIISKELLFVNIIPTGFVELNLPARLLLEAFGPLLTRSWSAAILYFIFMAMTFLFLIVYIKRFVTICILTVIAPLITVTYAIDKSGDGKAQALNKWFKEYIFNILIQPFHCIIYMVFLTHILYVINNTGAIEYGKVLIAIMMMGFMYKADDIVKAIFGFESKNLATAAMVGGAIINKAAKAGSIATSMKGIKNANIKAEEVKNVKRPNKMPSEGKNTTNSKNTNNNNSNKSTNSSQKSQTNSTNSKETPVRDRLHKWNEWSKKATKYVAKKSAISAIGYGLTGDYKGALAANSVEKSARKTFNEAKLSSRVKQVKNETLDAYEDYKLTKGLSTEDMLAKSKELLNADIETITDDEDRILAEFLQANKEVQEILGAKDPIKEVMKQLQDFEIG